MATGIYAKGSNGSTGLERIDRIARRADWPNLPPLVDGEEAFWKLQRPHPVRVVAVPPNQLQLFDPRHPFNPKYPIEPLA
jgi:hypothetical protein